MRWKIIDNNQPNEAKRVWVRQVNCNDRMEIDFGWYARYKSGCVSMIVYCTNKREREKMGGK